MGRTRGYTVAIVASVVLVMVATACGDDEPATAPELTALCSVTEAFSMEIPMLVAKGREPIPSGFDRINNAQCEFSIPIDSVVLELSSAGTVAAQHTVSLDAQSAISFPLPEAQRGPASADVAPGLYDRRISVSATDGQKTDVRNDKDAVYVVDLPLKDVEFARASMIAARQVLASELSLPLGEPALTALEAVEWNDGSLGCPEPDTQYIQVILPGFKFIFEQGGEAYEYHTNRDGSTVVECEAAG
jgi:hypothetical protein